MCGAFVDCAGASDCLKESFVTYANEAKEQMLGVKSETLARCGAVSGECAREMALGAARAAGADWAVSVTGIAGPGGGTAEKPVGTVWIGVAHRGAAQAREYHFRGQRQWIRKLSVVNALNQLRLAMEHEK